MITCCVIWLNSPYPHRTLLPQDELQEVLARTGMEMRYTEASMQARLATSEGQLEARKLARRGEAERARVQCDYETRANTEIESQLRDSLDVSQQDAEQ